METKDWKERIVKERTDLIFKTLKLKEFIDNPKTKLSKEEWRLLEEQLYSMKGYLRALTKRCSHYNLIEACDLDCYE